MESELTTRLHILEIVLAILSSCIFEHLVDAAFFEGFLFVRVSYTSKPDDGVLSLDGNEESEKARKRR